MAKIKCSTPVAMIRNSVTIVISRGLFLAVEYTHRAEQGTRRASRDILKGCMLRNKLSKMCARTMPLCPRDRIQYMNVILMNDASYELVYE